MLAGGGSQPGRNYQRHMDIASTRSGTIIANPYVVGRPLTGASASLYIGREDVFAWLAENLTGSIQPNAMLLYGRRRIGKTSTLYQLVEGERGRSLRENPDRPLLPAYIDLQRLAGRPTDEWLRRLARDMCQRVNTSSLDRTTPDSSVAGETAYAAFDRCLDRLEQTLPGDSLILLAIDEFEQIQAGIVAGTLEAEVLPFLRSQIQHRTRVAFLISGAYGLLDPFWNPIVDLTARYELGALTEEQTEALIRRPLEDILNFTDEAVDTIWRVSAGHPFLIQTICHRLVSLMNRRHARETIGPGDVDHVVHLMAVEGYFGDVVIDNGKMSDEHSPSHAPEVARP